MHSHIAAQNFEYQPVMSVTRIVSAIWCILSAVMSGNAHTTLLDVNNREHCDRQGSYVIHKTDAVVIQGASSREARFERCNITAVAGSGADYSGQGIHFDFTRYSIRTTGIVIRIFQASFKGPLLKSVLVHHLEGTEKPAPFQTQPPNKYLTMVFSYERPPRPVFNFSVTITSITRQAEPIKARDTFIKMVGGLSGGFVFILVSSFFCWLHLYRKHVENVRLEEERLVNDIIRLAPSDLPHAWEKFRRQRKLSLGPATPPCSCEDVFEGILDCAKKLVARTRTR